jgi:hypothetical protein
MEYSVCVCVCDIHEYNARTLLCRNSQHLPFSANAPRGACTKGIYMHLLAYDTRPYVASDVLMSFLAGIHGD